MNELQAGIRDKFKDEDEYGRGTPLAYPALTIGFNPFFHCMTL